MAHERKSRKSSATGAQQKFPLTVSREELLVNGSDEAFRSFIHAMLAFSARLSAIRANFAKLVGLSGPQYMILVLIGHLEATHDVSVQLVAERMHLSGAFVTIETGKLLKKGLIVKKPDGNDRRRVCLSLTPKGWALLEKLAPIQRRVNDVLFGDLTREQFEELCRLMPALVESADRALHLVRYYLSGGEPANGGARDSRNRRKEAVRS